ncbi:M48 family metalloprotease [Rickettsiales bacterium]|nr:M48 family metalloprotease [Rickettsiales bacterium]
MITKPLNIIFVLILSVINFSTLLLPLLVVFGPLFWVARDMFVDVGVDMFFFVAFSISSLMVIYVALDLIFGFTVSRYNRQSIHISKAKYIYGAQEIEESFNWLQKKFNMSRVQLYIGKDFDSINAYAVGSFRKKTIIITMGLINHIYESSRCQEEYVEALKGIIGHEMSHLSHKDFLPGLIVAANDSAIKIVEKIFRWSFVTLANIFRLIPFIGNLISSALIAIYKVTSFMITAFYKNIFTPLYFFLQNWLSRSVEYRCDRESAYAFGGSKISSALSMLGPGAYFSIFSTHPKTKSRIKNVQMVTARAGFIKPGVFDFVSNVIAISTILFLCAFTGLSVDMPRLFNRFSNDIYQPASAIASKLYEYSFSMYENIMKNFQK